MVSLSLDIFTFAAISLSISALCLVIIITIWLSRKVTSKYHTSSDVTDVVAVVSEFSQRMKRLEEALIDQKVKQEILQLRMERRPERDGAVVESPADDFERQRVSTASVAVRPMASPKPVVPKPTQSMVGNTEREVLRMVMEGEGLLTAKEIQLRIAKTREHIARMMNSLFKDGLVERDTSARPYSYSITDQGRRVLGS